MLSSGCWSRHGPLLRCVLCMIYDLVLPSFGWAWFDVGPHLVAHPPLTSLTAATGTRTNLYQTVFETVHSIIIIVSLDQQFLLQNIRWVEWSSMRSCHVCTRYLNTFLYSRSLRWHDGDWDTCNWLNQHRQAYHTSFSINQGSWNKTWRVPFLYLLYYLLYYLLLELLYTVYIIMEVVIVLKS